MLITIYTKLVELVVADQMIKPPPTNSVQVIAAKMQKFIEGLAVIQTAADPVELLARVLLFICHHAKNYTYIQTFLEKYIHAPFTFTLLCAKKKEAMYDTLFQAGEADHYVKWLCNL